MRLIRTALLLSALAAFAACGPKPTAVSGDDMTLGAATAPVEVVEYASVGCPYCGRWAREVFPAFKAKYVDTGKARFVFREMIVGGGVEVQLAAAGFLTARCAGKDKYFDVVEAIFQNQDAAFQEPRGTLQTIARGAGLTDEAFAQCITDEKSLAALNARAQKNAQVTTNTPTFVINGKAMPVGYQSLAELDAAIAAAAK
jgi:protein-disulfide isomerase